MKHFGEYSGDPALVMGCNNQKGSFLVLRLDDISENEYEWMADFVVRNYTAKNLAQAALSDSPPTRPGNSVSQYFSAKRSNNGNQGGSLITPPIHLCKMYDGDQAEDWITNNSVFTTKPKTHAFMELVSSKIDNDVRLKNLITNKEPEVVKVSEDDKLAYLQELGISPSDLAKYQTVGQNPNDNTTLKFDTVSTTTLKNEDSSELASVLKQLANGIEKLNEYSEKSLKLINENNKGVRSLATALRKQGVKDFHKPKTDAELEKVDEQS